MIRINLLPHREARRKASRQQFYALSGLVTVLAAVIWFAGFTYINAQIDRQSEKNAFLKKEIAVLDKQLEEIKKLREETEALLARKQVIESLQANRSETVHLFNELVRQLPPGVYLRSIKQDKQKVTLIGHAQSNARVSTLMNNLDGSPVLERPELVQIKAIPVGKRRMNEFTLNIYFSRQTTEETGKGAKKPGGKP
ncbi:MAG: PilN domain-containing protein [Rhodocyclaceae bacterium]|nr:PilN domain-containing protein [Rhodocyclaceae bacterium]MDP3038178.1 PilN domain-containing protein [Rhodocyclaceae bacterium]